MKARCPSLPGLLLAIVALVLATAGAAAAPVSAVSVPEVDADWTVDSPDDDPGPECDPVGDPVPEVPPEVEETILRFNAMLEAPVTTSSTSALECLRTQSASE